MSTRYIESRTGAASGWTGSDAGFGYDPTDDKLYVNPDGTRRAVVTEEATQSLAGKTVTGPAATEDVTATNLITAAESGTVFFLNSATEFVSTLPAPAAGLRYRFIVKAAPASASYTVVTTSSANIMIGHINEVTVDDGVDGSIATAGDTITFVDGTAVVGDWAEVISDGTSWYVTGQCSVAGGITITQASA